MKKSSPQIYLHHPWAGWPLGRQKPSSWNANHFPREASEIHFVMEDLPHAIRLPHRGRAFLLCMEPPEMKNFYDSNFLSQFEGIFSWRRDISQAGLSCRWVPYPWFYGIEFDLKEKVPVRWTNLCEMKDEADTFTRHRSVSCTFLVSPKNLCRNHDRRILLMRYLQERVPALQVHGFKRPFGDKRELLLDSQASIVVENHNEEDGFTEKIQDCFLAGAHPFYWGCRNLESYFPAESFTRIPLEDPSRCLEIIQAAIQKKIWGNNLGARQEARRRVLEEYNIYPALRGLGEKLAGSVVPERRSCARWLKPEWFFRDRGPRWLPRLCLSMLRRQFAQRNGDRATTLEIF